MIAIIIPVRTIHRTIQANISGMPKNQGLDTVEERGAGKDAKEGQHG